MLGGLLQDEYAGNEEKVPLLGDIPVVGNLFRTETRSRKKTNLMVFLRPVVVRDAVQSDVLSLDRYDLMRGMQEAAQPPSSVVVPINAAPMFPPLPPLPAAAPPQSGRSARSAALRPLQPLRSRQLRRSAAPAAPPGQ